LIARPKNFTAKTLVKRFAEPKSYVTLPSWMGLQQEQGMPLESHLAELERRHAALDRDIAQEWARPGADEIKLAELKRRKLQLKDEIAKLKSECQTETIH
jgi:hypothetical protein